MLRTMLLGAALAAALASAAPASADPQLAGRYTLT